MRRARRRTRELGTKQVVAVGMKRAAVQVAGLMLVLVVVSLVGWAPRAASSSWPLQLDDQDKRLAWPASPLSEGLVDAHQVSSPADGEQDDHLKAARQRHRNNHNYRRQRRRKRRRRSSTRQTTETETQVTRTTKIQNTLEAQRERKLHLLKRQAAELAVNRLHILESLDDQLAAFAKLATTRRDGGWSEADGQQVCTLRLPPLTNRTVGGQVPASSDHYVRASTCLSEARLRPHIPPFMLNLYSQLLAELAATSARSTWSWRSSSSSSSSSSGQLPSMGAIYNDDHEHHSNDQFSVPTLPYNARIMRSFRQPTINYYDHEEDEHENYGPGFGRLGDKRAPNETDKSPTDEEDSDKYRPGTGANLVVELSALAEGVERPQEAGAGEVEREDKGEHANRSPARSVCEPRQRLLAASKRSELCFAFHIGEHLRRQMNGLSRTGGSQGPHSSPQQPSARPSERVVEAELHLFKLFPELLADQVYLGNRSSPARMMIDERHHDQGQLRRRQTWQRSRRSTSTLYHLKTNLLEVSLYQVLPKRRDLDVNLDNQSQVEEANREYPLRLLDIRRIELDSSGWETFYVKRAVDDWLRDSSLNLGLVIKAKSMFDEPIRVGLIRFADLYDHRRPEGAAPPERPRPAASGGHPDDDDDDHEESNSSSLLEFDASHQPLLVIYTRTTDDV